MQTISDMIAHIERRARAYVDRIPGAVSGDEGHKKTFKVAIALARGFALPESTVLSILQDYNARCEPPWSKRELAHKARSAVNDSTQGCGYLLDAERHDMGPEEYAASDELVAAMIANDAARGHIKAAEQDATVLGEPVAPAAIQELSRAAIEKSRASHEQEEATARELMGRVIELGGLCASFPIWVDKSSRYPRPILNVGATIALGSAIFGRRVVTFSGRSLSQYIISAADTSAGKDQPNKCLQLALDNFESVRGPGGFSSSASTIERVRKTTDEDGCALLFISDEFGEKYTTMISQRSGHQADIGAFILQMATIGTSTYTTGQSLARGGKDIKIEAPCMSIFGSSTPGSLDSIFSSKQTSHGIANRFLLSYSKTSLPKKNRDHFRHDECPEDVRAAVESVRLSHEAWFDSSVGEQKVNGYKKPTRAQMAPDAYEYYEGLCDEIDDMRRNTRDKAKAAIWGRAGEKIASVATILACMAEVSDFAEVKKIHIEVATEYVRRSIADIEDICAGVSGRETMSPAEELSKLELWFKSHLVPSSRAEILRACRFLHAKTLSAALQTLEERESVEKIKSASGDGAGRPAILYQWKG